MPTSTPPESTQVGVVRPAIDRGGVSAQKKPMPAPIAPSRRRTHGVSEQVRQDHTRSPSTPESSPSSRVPQPWTKPTLPRRTVEDAIGR